jgi:hypothetical protein
MIEQDSCTWVWARNDLARDWLSGGKLASERGLPALASGRQDEALEYAATPRGAGRAFYPARPWSTRRCFT